ncbi:MAG: ATP-binding protein, partial [Chloroflexota bacterium]
LEQALFSLREMFAQTINQCKPSATQKGLYLSLHFGPNCPDRIIGDKARLAQIVINLLGNAVKFTQTGGIEIEVEAPHYLSTGQIEIKVKDTGIGIPPDRLDRLFKSFSQVDTSHTRQFGGTGLGLAICKNLVELMGGEIWVKSEVNRGSTFGVLIVSQVVRSDSLTEGERVP